MAVTEGQIRDAIREELYFNPPGQEIILTKLTEWTINEFDLCDEHVFDCFFGCDGCIKAAKLVLEVVTVYQLLMEGKLMEAKGA